MVEMFCYPTVLSVVVKAVDLSLLPHCAIVVVKNVMFEYFTAIPSCLCSCHSCWFIVAGTTVLFLLFATWDQILLCYCCVIRDQFCLLVLHCYSANMVESCSVTVHLVHTCTFKLSQSRYEPSAGQDSQHQS